MIVVREQTSADRKPFDCVAFVCDSRQAARNLTYALATAFQVIILIIIYTIGTYEYRTFPPSSKKIFVYNQIKTIVIILYKI